MPSLPSLALLLHVLAAVVWVGGMFFAYMVLRPVVGARLEPPKRLELWRFVLNRFFIWVWGAVVVLPATGYLLGLRMYGGMAHYPLYVHVMHGLGWLMIALFLYLFLVPFRGLRLAVTAEDWPAGGRALAGIRRIVGINLVLGLVVVALASGGRLGLLGW